MQFVAYSPGERKCLRPFWHGNFSRTGEWELPLLMPKGLPRRARTCHPIRNMNDSYTSWQEWAMVSRSESEISLWYCHTQLAIAVRMIHIRPSHVRLRFKGNLSSAFTSITDLRLGFRTFQRKIYLWWTHWTTSRRRLQQGSERTRVEPWTSRLDLRTLDRSEQTNWYRAHNWQKATTILALPVVTWHLADGAAKPTSQY